MERVKAAMDGLHHGLKDRASARLEALIAEGNLEALDLAAQDPGLFARDLLRLQAVFGRPALERFASVMEALTTDRLVSLEKHLRTAEGRSLRLVRPRGDWTRAQRVEKPLPKGTQEDRMWLADRLSDLRVARLCKAFPGGVTVKDDARSVVLTQNGQTLAPYGPGTSFAVPANATFLRTASYWEQPSTGNTWFDNGWVFFDEDWSPVGQCTWDGPSMEGAAFSGDPTNSKDLKGRGCQMIDLYLEKLRKAGARYGMWSILAYSHIKFSEAKDVVASLQWGEKAQKGKLYEPARAQMVFPIKADGLIACVAWMDFETRQVHAMDVPLPGTVSSAGNNARLWSSLMPAFAEHAAHLPTVGDLFAGVPEGPGATVVRSDADAPVSGRAWVMEPVNEDSAFDPIDLAALRAAKA